MNRSCELRAILLALVGFSTGMPMLAQVGQSDLITPGGTEDTTFQQGAGNVSQSPSQSWSNGVTPGRGWLPPASGSMLTPGARFHQKPAGSTNYQQMTPVMAPSAVQDDAQDISDNMGWSTVPKQRPRQAAQSMPQQMMQSGSPGSAFQASGTHQRFSDFELPSAADQDQVEEQPGWAAPMQQRIQQQMAPKSVAAKQLNPGMAMPKPSSPLNGRVSQQAGLNPGFPAMPMDNGMGNMGGMNGMGNMNGMNGMGNMGGMNGMGNMGGMNGMGNMGGMNGMNGMGNMGGMNGMGNMGGMNGMGNMGGMNGMGNMGGMNAMGNMGGMNAMDLFGKAIAGAAQMGLIPGAKSQGVPNVPPGTIYNQPGGGFGGAGSSAGMSPMMQPMGIGQQLSRTVNRVPGVQTGKQIGRQMNNAVQRNVNYAINTGARRSIQNLLRRM